jgi:hypothetical protein
MEIFVLCMIVITLLQSKFPPFVEAESRLKSLRTREIPASLLPQEHRRRRNTSQGNMPVRGRSLTEVTHEQSQSGYPGSRLNSGLPSLEYVSISDR